MENEELNHSKDFFLNKKRYLLENYYWDDFNSMKSTKLLRLIIEEIIELEHFFTKREIVTLINESFKTNISIHLFYKFCNKYIDNLELSSKKSVNKTFKKINSHSSNNSSIDSNKNIHSLTESTIDLITRNLPKK